MFIQPTLAKALSVAFDSATPVALRRSALQGHLHTPSTSTGSGRKSSKRSHVGGTLESVGNDQFQLAELARSSQGIKIEGMKMKRMKLEQQMKEKEFAHQECMMQYQLEFARLQAGQASATSCAVSPRQGDCSTNAYPSNVNFTPEFYTFSMDTSSTSLPSHTPTSWGLPEASGSQL